MTATGSGSSSLGSLCFLETEDWAFLKHRLALGRAALAAGFKVTLIAPVSEAAAKLRAEGFEVLPLTLARTGTNPMEEARAIADITSIYRRIKPDIVHHLSVKAVLHGSIAARLAGVPAIVNSITGLGYTFVPGGGPRQRALQSVIVTLLRGALASPRVRVIFQNPDDQDLFIERRVIRRDRSILVRGSGVNTQRFAPCPEPEGPPVVVLASRLIWDKGVGELVEAARMLRAEGLTFRILLAGVPDPANPNSIDPAVLAGWVAEGIVENPGYVEDVPGLLAAAHIACLPSFYREGLPLFLLEAAAAGRPVVTTDSPGCRDAVVDGETGLMVPVRDSAALAKALRTLISDPVTRARMGAAGRARVLDHFSNESIIRGIFDVYADLLGVQVA